MFWTCSGCLYLRQFKIHFVFVVLTCADFACIYIILSLIKEKFLSQMRAPHEEFLRRDYEDRESRVKIFLKGYMEIYYFRSSSVCMCVCV